MMNLCGQRFATYEGATGIPYATTITPAPGLGRRHEIGAE
jgi:hypothetical protein